MIHTAQSCYFLLKINLDFQYCMNSQSFLQLSYCILCFMILEMFLPEVSLVCRDDGLPVPGPGQGDGELPRLLGDRGRGAHTVIEGRFLLPVPCLPGVIDLQTAVEFLPTCLWNIKIQC